MPHLAGPGDEDVVARRADLAAQLTPQFNPAQSQRSFYESQTKDLELSADITRSSGAQVLTVADAPDSPVSPKPVCGAALPLILGLALGAGQPTILL